MDLGLLYTTLLGYLSDSLLRDRELERASKELAQNVLNFTPQMYFCTEGGHRNFYGSNLFRIMSFQNS
jgi:hypothetical protein